MNNIIAEKKYIADTLGVPYENLSQAHLRAETALTSGSTIDFTLQKGKKDASSLLVTEKLIELNDQFVVTHFSVAIKTIGSDTPTALQQLTTDLDFYADGNKYTGTNRPNVAAIYNATLNWTIDRKEFLPQFPMDAFRRVPETQTAANADYTTSGIIRTNSNTNGLFGFYPCEPIILDGRQTNNLSIELGTSVDFDDASSTSYAVVRLRGYLVVNAKN